MEIHEYSPRLKDDLVRLYNFIERFKNDEDKKDWCQFTEFGINQTSHFLTGSHCGEVYAKKFLQMLPQIKWLSENQPTHEFKCTYEMIDENGGKYSHITNHVIKTFDVNHAEYLAKLNNRRATEIKKVK
jgi:hypothetical protein